MVWMLTVVKDVNVQFFCFRLDLCNDKFLKTVGKSEKSRNKYFSTTENAPIVVNRCGT